LLDGQMGQESLDLLLPHIPGTRLAPVVPDI
jgi:hypothetical protein